MAQNHYSDEWILVGESAQNAFLVRGGAEPICIPVKHNNSSHLLDLIGDANEAIRARQASKRAG